MVVSKPISSNMLLKFIHRDLLKFTFINPYGQTHAIVLKILPLIKCRQHPLSLFLVRKPSNWILFLTVACLNIMQGILWLLVSVRSENMILQLSVLYTAKKNDKAICDQICEKRSSAYIKFTNFNDS